MFLAGVIVVSFAGSCARVSLRRLGADHGCPPLAVLGTGACKRNRCRSLVPLISHCCCAQFVDLVMDVECARVEGGGFGLDSVLLEFLSGRWQLLGLRLVGVPLPTLLLVDPALSADGFSHVFEPTTPLFRVCQTSTRHRRVVELRFSTDLDR